MSSSFRRMICAETRITRLRFSFCFRSDENARPIMGRSARTGMPEFEVNLTSFISPERSSVPPSGSVTVVRTLLSSTVGSCTI